MAKAKATQAKTRRKRSHPTQQDIAKTLGLGQSTVAMALNPEQRHRLQETTVERVLRCATRMGYRSGHFSPESLRSWTASRDKPVIALVGDLGSAHSQQLFDMLINNFNRYDVDLVPVVYRWFDGSSQRLWQHLSTYQLSGVVLYNMVVASQAEDVRRMVMPDLPLVALQCTLNGVINLNFNFEEAFLHLTSLHLAAGAKELGILLGPRDRGVMVPAGRIFNSRVKGFMAALYNAGGQVVSSPEIIELMRLAGVHLTAKKPREGCVGTVHCYESPGELKDLHGYGYFVACDLIDGGTLPEVMLCSNDQIAFGFLCACLERGVRVPQDVALCGFDDNNWVRFAPVALSTVRHPDEIFAREAVRTIIDLVEGRTDSSVIYEKYFPLQIVLRESSGDLSHLRTLLAGRPASRGKNFVLEPNSTLRPAVPDKRSASASPVPVVTVEQ